MKNIKEIRELISIVDEEVLSNEEEVKNGNKQWYEVLDQSVLHCCLSSKEYLDQWDHETIDTLVMNDDYYINVQSVVRDMKHLRSELDRVGISQEELELYLSETEDDR